MQRAGDLLDAFLDRIGASDRQYASFFRNWQRIAGERIAAHAKVSDIKNGTLIIDADHPAWVQMVMLRQRSIIDTVNSSYPDFKITSIRVRVASADPDLESPATRQDTDQEITQTEDDRRISQPEPTDEASALSRIADDELRESLERLRNELS